MFMTTIVAFALKIEGPNLQDEADNHVLELAVAGNAACIITANKRDFVTSEMKFSGVAILNPVEFLDRGDFVT
jgi:predicted nucleic acid-binding protein